jgi:hypothetical protein
MTEDPAGGPGAQHLGVVDVAATSDDVCTNVMILRPGANPPTRPPKRIVALINDSSSSRNANVAVKINPALATSDSSSKLTSTRSKPCDTRPTESASRVG